MIGTTVGSYRITAKVSIGGMGTVYKAEHTLIGKHAAVKVLHPELRNNRDVVQRFFNEAKATTQIKHPGIVEMFDFGYLPSGDGYIVMEFLEGVSLARRLKKQGKMHEGEAAVLMRSVCSALAAAHAKGIVHRDLKPDNIFLTPDPDAATGERPKILDFGIAKLNVGLTGPGNATKTGAVMGTPTYMSPEQCKGTGEVDHRADLYSIGCMFYEMVAGRPPFDNMGAGELIGAHLYVEPVKPSTCGAEISPSTELLIMQLLQKNPSKRPQTAQELGSRFGHLAQGFGLVTRATPTALRTKIDKHDPTDDLETQNHQFGSSPEVEGIAPTYPSDPGTSGLTPSTPSAAAVNASADAPHATMQPTTLSGAASQSMMSQRRSRVGLFAALAAGTLISGAAAFFIVTNNTKASSPSEAPATTPAGQPVAAPTPPAPTPAPTPTAPTPAPTPPAPTPPVVETPPPVAAETPPVVPDTKPTTTAAADKPVEAPKKRPKKETKPTKPATATTTTAKPTTTTTKPTTTTTKPTTTKPTEKPKTGSGILIETDI